ncbi:Vacuolar protein sorting-associated protein 20 [Sporothrix stenoceras]|uniref:Vacuolar protein sorting-associated protein 20 n=1 Tax=Sporothrix stenoceras TaxID=5173 RepID=A0ABR3ZMQ6_9PEZI
MYEVSEMLGGSMSVADEDEVEDELAALEAELAPAQPAKVVLPNAPNTQPVAAQDPIAAEEEEEPQPERRQLVPA